METNAFKRPLVAALVIACGTVLAQTVVEQASVWVNRFAPSKAPFAEALVAQLRVPAGFAVTVFASELGQPRMMELGPDGTVYVTRRGSDDVVALRDADGDGKAESRSVFAGQLNGVHGIARLGDQLYLASSTTIWRTPLATAVPTVIVSGLPDGGQHPNRTVRLGPDGRLWVSIGSSCNDCAEENQLERGTMVRYQPDGSGREFMAKGLRNTIGYDWHPVTGALWGLDHGSDFRGDDLPPEELNEIKPGTNYGWPVCYADRVVDPLTNATPERLTLRPGESKPSVRQISRADYCARTEGSVLNLQAHSAPMAMRFYTAGAFPTAYRNDAFAAMRGSWNRGSPVGYKVVRLRFGTDGRPAGVEDFLTGFLRPDGASFIGRPTGVVVAADGALLVSDDSNGVIYRVSWNGSSRR